MMKKFCVVDEGLAKKAREISVLTTITAKQAYCRLGQLIEGKGLSFEDAEEILFLELRIKLNYGLHLQELGIV